MSGSSWQAGGSLSPSRENEKCRGRLLLVLFMGAIINYHLNEEMRADIFLLRQEKDLFQLSNCLLRLGSPERTPSQTVKR